MIRIKKSCEGCKAGERGCRLGYKTKEVPFKVGTDMFVEMVPEEACEKPKTIKYFFALLAEKKLI